MSDWKQYYNDHLCTADEAIRIINDGDELVFGHCIGEPQTIIDALLESAEAFKNVTIHQQYTIGDAKYTSAEYEGHFHFNGWFLTPATMHCVAEGRGDVTPNHYFKTTEYFDKDIFHCDVAIVMSAPPNEHGLFCTGVSCDHTMDAVRHADRIIVQVNKNMPFTYGDTYFPVEMADCIVESDQELNQFLPPHYGNLGEDDLAIGEYCASLIPDKATISIGVGRIPDAVCYCLKNKHELGVFTDMFSDGMMDLYLNGNITNQHCTTDKNVMVTAFVMGSQKLYNFVNRNPVVRFMSASYVNNTFRLASQSNMCIVNSAVSVDLQGQIVSASIGELQLSGVGGQPSLNRGANMSLDRKGKSIIAMASTVRDFSGNLVSKITPFINPGSEVTLNREDAGYIVTENGIAYMKGKSLEDRSRELIGIAHPQFRDELIEEFERRYRTKF